MNYKLLGRSGLRVSELCLGTMGFGEDWGWGSNKEECRRTFDLYSEAGGNFLDTADGYTNGTSERFVGEFVAANRDHYVIASKYSFNRSPGDPNAGGNHRKNLVRALEASLQRLNTDYLDLYWVHAFDTFTPIDEVMRALDDLVRSGKVLYVGFSNFPAWIVSRANTLAELHGWTPFIGAQIEYSLLQRTPERDVIPMCRALDIGITAWSPLAGGFLTGRYTRDGARDGRLAHVPELVDFNDRNFAILEAVLEIARSLSRPPAQVALNWVRQRHNIVPILGARTARQIQDNLAALEFEISPSDLDRLDAVSSISAGYPHDFLRRPRVLSVFHGGTYDRVFNHRATAPHVPGAKPSSS